MLLFLLFKYGRTQAFLGRRNGDVMNFTAQSLEVSRGYTLSLAQIGDLYQMALPPSLHVHVRYMYVTIVTSQYFVTCNLITNQAVL